MRDYLAAVRSGVVVFDGGMGATLEEFDLTPEDYGGLAGKCHEALVLNRPDVIEGVHASMVEAGARRGRDRHLPGQPPQARGVGPRRAHAGDQPQGRRDRAPRGRRGALRRRLDRPDRPPPRLRRPDARQDPLPRARRDLRRAGARPGRGRRRRADHRDRAGHPRGQGGDRRRPRGVRRDRPQRADPGSVTLCRTAAGCCSAPTSPRR